MVLFFFLSAIIMVRTNLEKDVENAHYAYPNNEGKQ